MPKKPFTLCRAGGKRKRLHDCQCVDLDKNIPKR